MLGEYAVPANKNVEPTALPLYHWGMPTKQVAVNVTVPASQRLAGVTLPLVGAAGFVLTVPITGVLLVDGLSQPVNVFLQPT